MGKFLCNGNVVDVQRGGAEGGFTRGTCELRVADGDASELKSDSRVTVHFQNENSMVIDENNNVLATVPDLICLLARDTGRPVYVDEIAYGQRLSLIVLPADPHYTAPESAALKATSPEAFGFADQKPVLLPPTENRAEFDQPLF